jgi:hypothetical protein
MGRADLIGNAKHQLIPTNQPINKESGEYSTARKKNSSVAGDSRKRSTSLPTVQPKKGQILTQHTGLPPRVTGAKKQKV